MKQIIHIATVEHQAGMDHYTASTEKELTAQLAVHCRAHWETCEHRKDEIPEDDDMCVEFYFDDHDSETLMTSCNSVEVEPPASRDLVNAMLMHEWYVSLHTALSEAGGSLKTAPGDLGRMTLAELGSIAAPNGIRFASLPHDENRSIRRAVEAAASRASAAFNLL